MLRFGVKPTITEKREGGRKKEKKGGGVKLFSFGRDDP